VIIEVTTPRTTMVKPPERVECRTWDLRGEDKRVLVCYSVDGRITRVFNALGWLEFRVVEE
jgi:hypothetical protein